MRAPSYGDRVFLNVPFDRRYRAISLGGDADTLACITGAIAEAHYGGVPADIAVRTLAALDDRLRSVVLQFCDRFSIGAA